VCISRWQTILTRVSLPSQKTIYNFKLVVGHTTKHMKHGRSCDIEIWWPRLKMSHSGCALVRHFQPRVHHISMSHLLLCIICIVYIALLAANSVNRSKKKAGIFRINTDLAAKRSFYPRDAMLARMLSMALSVSVCLFITSRWSTKRDKWIELVFGTGAFPTYPTLWLKEIRVSAKKATSLWNSVPNSGLKNFASAYRLSKRVMDLARQRSTLRAW